MNGFNIQALAEKVAALRARSRLQDLSEDEQSAYLGARASRARPGIVAEILAIVGTTHEVLQGDEVPADWLQR
jgi:hypothetical protein